MEKNFYLVEVKENLYEFEIEGDFCEFESDLYEYEDELREVRGYLFIKGGKFSFIERFLEYEYEDLEEYEDLIEYGYEDLIE